MLNLFEGIRRRDRMKKTETAALRDLKRVLLEARRGWASAHRALDDVLNTWRLGVDPLPVEELERLREIERKRWESAEMLADIGRRSYGVDL